MAQFLCLLLSMHATVIELTLIHFGVTYWNTRNIFAVGTPNAVSGKVHADGLQPEARKPGRTVTERIKSYS